MKVLWCWRCKLDVPMLDEAEFERVARLYGEPFRNLKASRASDTPPNSLTAVFAPVCAEYERLTGFPETNANAVMHHRLSLYGPPCATCGKPLAPPRRATVWHVGSRGEWGMTPFGAWDEDCKAVRMGAMYLPWSVGTLWVHCPREDGSGT